MQKSKRKAASGLLIPRPAVKGMPVPIPIVEGMTPRMVRLNDAIKQTQILGPGLAKLGIDVSSHLELYAAAGLIELLGRPHRHEIGQCWLAHFISEVLIETAAEGAAALANNPDEVRGMLKEAIDDFERDVHEAREIAAEYADYLPLKSEAEPAAVVATA